MRPAHLSRTRLLAGYGRFLLWEFRWPLGLFWGVVVVTGVLFWLTYHDQEGHALSLAEACYGVFMMIFLETYLEFAAEWYLQPFFFLVPIVGLGAIADSIVRLAYLVFARKSNLQEWQRMVASMHRNHIVVLGLGKVGYSIIRGLLDLREAVVVVDKNTEAPFLPELQDLGVPVVQGEGRQKKTLELANVAKAKAIVLATSDDLTNLDAALTARDIQPHIRVVIRLFDNTLADKVAGAFAMPAISTAKVSAPAFIAAATGRKVYHDFELAGQHLHLVDLTVAAGGGLDGQTVGQIQADSQINVVMQRGPMGVSVNPQGNLPLAAGDTLLVIAPLEKLIALEATNQPRNAVPA